MPPKKVSLPPNPPPHPSQNIALQYTTFFSVAPLNAKNVSSSYLKTEAQTWISRSQAAAQALPQSKKSRLDAVADAADASVNMDQDDHLQPEEGERETAENTPAHRTIVIHPGSENLRLGRATDLFPISLPNVIARRAKKAAPPKSTDEAKAANGTAGHDKTPKGADGEQIDVDMADKADAEENEQDDDPAKASRKNPRRSAATAASLSATKAAGDDAQAQEEEEEHVAKSKPTLSQGIEAIRNDLRAIMRQEKLRSVGNAKNLAANYNDSSQPEDVPEHNDLFALEWIDQDAGGDNDLLVGEQALRLACFSQPNTAEPKQQGRRQQQLSSVKTLSPPDSSRPWTLFRPFQRGTLDLNSYQEHYGASAAVQALLGDVCSILEHAITSPPEDTDDRQESGKVAPLGLGIPRQDFHDYTVILIIPDLFCRSDVKALTELLLVDMGFAQACVQQESVCATFGAGLSSGCVVDLGADKISMSCVEEGLILPETRILLSYGGADLTHFLAELFIRAKFPYRELDHRKSIADTMMIDELKRKLITLNPADVGLNIHDFYLRLPSRPTIKYLFRTYDELIVGPMSLFDPAVFDLDSKKMLRGKSRAGQAEEKDGGGDEGLGEDAPELSLLRGLDIPVTGAMTSCVKHLLPPPPVPATQPTAAATAAAAGGADKSAPDTAAAAAGSQIGTPAPTAPAKVDSTMPSRAASPSTKPENSATLDTNTLPSTDPCARPSPMPLEPTRINEAEPATPDPRTPTIDIPFEASKTPLDIAIFNSLLTSIGQVGPAGDERLRKMSNNILCVGGTAQIPGLAAALEARLTAMLANHFAMTTGDAGNAPKVTVIPPPRDMDPQVMAWKGMSVFARLEAASSELCLRRQDWFLFGWRALREKTLFL